MHIDLPALLTHIELVGSVQSQLDIPTWLGNSPFESQRYIFCSTFTPPFIKVVALGIFGCLNQRSTAKPIPTSHPPCESGPCAQIPQHWQESSHCHHLLHQVKMVKMSKCRTSLGSCDSVYKLETWMRIRRGSYIHQTSTSRIKNAYYAYISRHISSVKIQPSGYIYSISYRAYPMLILPILPIHTLDDSII